jgi:hypothetical protein
MRAKHLIHKDFNIHTIEVSFNASFRMLQDLLHIQIQNIQVIQLTRVIQVIQVIRAIRIGEGERGNRERQHFQAMLIDLFNKLRFFDAGKDFEKFGDDAVL